MYYILKVNMYFSVCRTVTDLFSQGVCRLILGFGIVVFNKDLFLRGTEVELDGSIASG